MMIIIFCILHLQVSANVTEDSDMRSTIRLSIGMEAPTAECASAMYILVDLPDPIVVYYYYCSYGHTPDQSSLTRYC